MKDRIQVDGVWYVRESSTLPIVEIDEMLVTNTLGCIWESDNWCFEATAILREEAVDLTDIYTTIIDIVITDKRNADRDKWIEWLSEIMKEVNRVLKPGAYGCVWSLPRTSHWTAMALEYAGFEIRDCIYHIFGTGFPKSMDISKAIDKKFGAEREKIINPLANKQTGQIAGKGLSGAKNAIDYIEPYPITEQAKQWDGFGTALKPAVECWWLIRKPISEKTVADNVLKWGTGGINIDDCRIEYKDEKDKIQGQSSRQSERHGKNQVFVSGDRSNRDYITGRFPANVIFDEDAGKMLDEQSGILKSGDILDDFH
jgi:site-specific DNA-methyltransferase (adenine-specific)